MDNKYQQIENLIKLSGTIDELMTELKELLNDLNEGSDHSLGRLKNIVGPNTELGSSIGKIMNEINQANNMAFESFQKISTLIMDKAKEADRLANESIGGYETISTMTDDMTWH